MKRISICTVTYNRSELLARSLDSWQAAIGRGMDCELIISDFGSTDNPLKEWVVWPCDLKIHSLSGVFSLGRGRNEAVKLASGDVLFVLDADMLVPPDFFERLYSLSVAFPIYERQQKDGSLIWTESPGRGNCVISKEHVNRLGNDLWPEYTTWGGEDTVFASRVRDSGLPIWRERVSGFVHQWHTKDRGGWYGV